MFRIELQTFDSGRVAGRVGIVYLDDQTSVPPELAAAILDLGRQQGYDLLCLRTSDPIALEGFEPRGVVIELEGGLEDIHERLRRLPARTGIRTLADGDWPVVGELLRWAGPTRFSTDPQLSDDSAREHKLAMLRTHASKYPDNALVAFAEDADADVVGFQISYWDEDVAVLYETAVAPAFRRRFVAVSLLAENVRRLRSAGRDRRVLSRIYSDNTASIRLFERIGMRRTGREDHYFHAWLKGPFQNEEDTMKDNIRRYLEESFLIEFGNAVTAETDLFEAQIIDSFGFVDLVTYLESTFEIKITDEDLLSSRLTTLNKIVALIQERVLVSSRA